MALLDSLLWRLTLLRAFDESLPQQSLLFPVGGDRNLTNFAFAESWHVVGGWLQIEDGLLDVGGEVGKVEDLRDAGAGDAGDAGDLRLVFDLAVCQQVIEANCESHQLGDVRHPRRCNWPLGFRCSNALATM